MPRRSGHHPRSRSRDLLERTEETDHTSASSTRSDETEYTFGSSTSSGHTYDTTPEGARLPADSDNETIREEGEVASDEENGRFFPPIEWEQHDGEGERRNGYPSPESIRTISPEPVPDGHMDNEREELRCLKRQLEKWRKKAERAEQNYRKDHRHKRHLQYKIRRLKDESYQKTERIACLDYQRRRLIEENNELNEEIGHLSDVSQQYYLSKEKERSSRQSTARHLERTIQECETLKSVIRSVQDSQETARALRSERDRANNYRRLMHNMSSLLYQDVEKREGAEPAAWKICEICIREYSHHRDTTPRVLTGCGHTVCHSCIRTLEAQGPEDNGIRCPFDRTLTTFPSGSLSNLPKNYALLGL